MSSNKNIYCYGSYKFSEKCLDCMFIGYCRTATRDDRIDSAFSNAGAREDLLTSEDPPLDPADINDDEKYTRRDFLRIIRFFLEQNPEQFIIIKLRMLRPELTMQEIAALMRYKSPKKVYDYLAKICDDHPAMRPLLYITKDAKNTGE